MISSIARGVALAATLLGLAVCLPAHAAKPVEWGPDAAGGADHPLVKRFAGSWLIGYKVTEWDQTRLPVGPKLKDHLWSEVADVEGKITRLFYLAPVGKSRLEVYRNYEQALIGAGLKKRFACEKDCSDLYFGMDKSTEYRKAVTWAKGFIPKLNSDSRYSLESPLSYDEGRLLYGTIERGGQQFHVFMYTSVATNSSTDIAATYLQIVEPRPMQTGQVTVQAGALKSGLESEGKVALYGIFFDTGKAEIKPESKAQLDEMGKLLQQQPALKVFVVGHTDNQGTVDGNLALSLQRATAVSNALVSGYRIDAKRLQAKGVANLAPLATNASEEGRARNRRVELVMQ